TGPRGAGQMQGTVTRHARSHVIIYPSTSVVTSQRARTPPKPNLTAGGESHERKLRRNKARVCHEQCRSVAVSQCKAIRDEQRTKNQKESRDNGDNRDLNTVEPVEDFHV